MMSEPAGQGQGQRQGQGRGLASRVGRRRFLAGLGAGGLAAAVAVFGFPDAASAAPEGCNGIVYECCCLCCAASQSMSACTTGSYYVWSCVPYWEGGEVYCDCCEHDSGCVNDCKNGSFSTYACYEN